MRTDLFKIINLNNDKKILLNFVYFNCKDYCPILLRNMRFISNFNNNNLLLITISFDSDNDDYNKINRFWLNNGSKKNWSIFVLDKGNYSNSDFFSSFWFKKTRFNLYTHTNFFILLDNKKIIKIFNQFDNVFKIFNYL